MAYALATFTIISKRERGRTWKIHIYSKLAKKKWIKDYDMIFWKGFYIAYFILCKVHDDLSSLFNEITCMIMTVELCLTSIIYQILTWRIHFAVRLFSNQRWRQSVVRTKKWRTSRKANASLMFLPHFEVICDHYWTDAQQHGIYLFHFSEEVTKLTVLSYMGLSSNRS